MLKRYILLFMLFISCFFTPIANAKHIHSEKHYQELYCSKFNGITEYRLKDNTRVDCLTKDYAIEFDFANKWAESIGQSLYYALQTQHKPMIVLIMENLEKDVKYLKRLNAVADTLGIKVYTIEK